MKKFLFLIFILTTSCSTFQPFNDSESIVEKKIQKYIIRYAPVAVKNMRFYKIPASITLAQGVLESGYGEGTLAVKANNHFGIKCHKGWKGKSIKHLSLIHI